MAIELVVVTPEGRAFQGPVEEVVLPGVEGEFGVLEAHERFLSALTHGCMEIRGAQGPAPELSAVSDGFAEVGPERVVVMVDSVVPRDRIDVAAARQDLERARSELDRPGSAGHADRAEWEELAARASAQLAVAERG